MLIVNLLIMLRPWMLVTKLLSRYRRPISGIIASARTSRSSQVSWFSVQCCCTTASLRHRHHR